MISKDNYKLKLNNINILNILLSKINFEQIQMIKVTNKKLNWNLIACLFYCSREVFIDFKSIRTVSRSF